MIAHFALHLAVRAHALACVVATTGSTTLAATATGYTRLTGSFLDDGFAAGMEVTPSGFTETATGVITAVSALAMTIKGGRSVEASGAGRTLTANLPSARLYENVPLTPTADEPYLVESYLPGGLTKATLGQRGELEATPTYVLQLYAPPATGIGAIRRTLDALTAHFAPGTAIAVGSDVARVRGDVAPIQSQLTQTEAGWAVATLTIPLRIRTANSR